MQDVFRKVALFSEFDKQELDAVVALATTHNVGKNNVIVHEGEDGNSMFVVLQGSVKISYYSIDGREVILSLLEEGAFFGEMSLLDKQPRSATVTTLEASKIAQIRRKDFERLLLSTPSLSLKLLAEVVGRLRKTSLVLERISTMDVPHRLYSYLGDYCERFGKASEQGSIISLPTHQLMADQLSTSRETISRAISSLKKEGIICPAQGSKQVCVDTDALETLLSALQ
ncbi:MAG: Crp/Fnr family transcriptional regulator [Mariprofundaceae bacterium]